MMIEPFDTLSVSAFGARHEDRVRAFEALHLQQDLKVRSRGAGHGRAIIVDGVRYASACAASNATGLAESALRRLCDGGGGKRKYRARLGARRGKMISYAARWAE